MFTVTVCVIGTVLEYGVQLSVYLVCCVIADDVCEPLRPDHVSPLVPVTVHEPSAGFDGDDMSVENHDTCAVPPRWTKDGATLSVADGWAADAPQLPAEHPYRQVATSALSGLHAGASL